MDYDDFQTTDESAAPPWLADAAGWLWNWCLGVIKDAFKDTLQAAVQSRVASRVSVDGLPVLLDDRNLEPAWRENETSVRQRIRKAWETWEYQGTPEGIRQALRLAGYQNFEVREQPQDGTLKVWEFEVWIYPPFPWADQYLADGRWDDAGVWDDGGAWSADLPPADLNRLRLAIRKWKGVHPRCRAIVIVHAGETWDGDAPPGTWDDDPTATWGDDVSTLNV